MNPPTSRRSVSDILGVPPLARSGRQRLIASAIELFYRHGFGAVGIDQVIADAGVTKTTFYKHFESREELIVAAVRQRDEWETAAWLRAVRARGGGDPGDRMLAWVDLLDEWFNAPDYAGCMFVNAAAEFPNPHDPVHQAAAEHMRRVQAHWRSMFLESGVSEPVAASLTDCYLALIEGALMLRQTMGRDDAARAIRPGVEQLIKAFLSLPALPAPPGDPPSASATQPAARHRRPAAVRPRRKSGKA